MPDILSVEPIRSPTISVIITVFRRVDFLAAAIESVLAQTLTPDEIIVSDDSASPEVRVVCARFADRGVRYRSNTPTLGVALNLSTAAAEAKGELLAILNDDDLWESEFLAALIPAFSLGTECVVAFSDHWIISGDGTIDRAASESNTRRYGRQELRPGPVSDPARLVLQYNGLPLAMAAVFKKEAVDWSRFPGEVCGAYDFWISCRLAASGKTFFYVPRRLTRYRLHASMETARQAADKNEHRIFIFRSLLEEKCFPEWNYHLRSELAGAFRAAGRDRLRFGLPAEGRTLFWKAIRQSPTIKGISGLLLSFLPAPVRNILVK